jgi:protein lysine acetyltransferase
MRGRDRQPHEATPAWTLERSRLADGGGGRPRAECIVGSRSTAVRRRCVGHGLLGPLRAGVTIAMDNQNSAAARDPHARALASVQTRPLGPGDRERLVAFFARLSAESRYRRFFEIKPELTAKELDWLTIINHVDHEAIVAVDQCDGSIVGVCRYVRERDEPVTAELAIAIADTWQNRGVGALLAEQVVRRAAENGLRRVRAFTLSGNRPALALFRRLGFQRVRRQGAEVELVRQLGSPAGVVVPFTPPPGDRPTP